METDIDQIKKLGSIEKMAEFMSTNEHLLNAASRLNESETSLLSNFYRKLDEAPTSKGTRKLFNELLKLLSMEVYEAAQTLFFACLKRAEKAYLDLLKSDFSERVDVHLTKCREASMWISVANHCQILIRRHYV